MSGITISMPVFKTGALTRRAVESVLAQTYRDFSLIVVSDNDPNVFNYLEDIRDSRLVRFELTENRGRYYIDQLTLRACRSRYWKPHDSDDWSEKNQLSSLARAIKKHRLVFSSWYHHTIRGDIKKHPVIVSRAGPAFRHFCHHGASLFRPSALLAVGGPHPEMRGSADTFFTNLLVMRWGEEINVIDFPTYHRVRRPGSLITSPLTDLKSAWRHEQQALRDAIWLELSSRPPESWDRLPLVSEATESALRADQRRLEAIA